MKKTEGVKAKEDKYKFSEEVAKDQMQEFMDYYDIDKDDIVVDQGPEALDTIYNRLVRAIRTGNLEITFSGEGISVIQHLKFPPGDVSKIEYGELTGKNKLAMDKINDGKGVERIHALMASLSGLPGEAMAKLKGSDLSIMERLATLFMVV